MVRRRISLSQSDPRAIRLRSFACSPKAFPPNAAGARLICTTMPSTSAIRGRRNARISAITSGGAIPDTADYAVVLEPSDLVIGSVNEDFAIESLQGDIFQLGNTSWRVLRVEQGKGARRRCTRPAAFDSLLAGRSARPHP